MSTFSEDLPPSRWAQDKITVTEVEAMLRKAGAPEPWANPELCHFASGMMTVRKVRMRQTAENPSKKTAHERGQEAIDTLRKVLPEIIYWHSLPVEGVTEEVGERLSAVRAEHLSKLTSLNEALVDLWPRKGKQERLEGEWADRAFLALNLYKSIVGTGSMSRNGPACRFVSEALIAMGDGIKELSAIEQALRRRETNRP